MNILVTGANGFIGKNIIDVLLKEYGEHQIIGTGRGENRNSKLINYVSADITDKEFVNSMIDKFGHYDVIVHTAACLGKTSSQTEELIKTNCLGSYNILQLANKSGCKKIIHTSGITVIGIPKNLPIMETHRTEPNSMYHITKLTSEYILNLAKNTGIKVTNLRIPSPVGAGMNDNTILPVFIRKAINNEKIMLDGKGTRKQNYVHVKDIARAVNLAVKQDVCGLFNIAADNTVSNLELAQKCIEVLHSASEIIFSGKEDAADSFVWDISIQKAHQELGYIPQCTLEQTILEIADMYQRKTL